jgi:hypothetical protein
MPSIGQRIRGAWDGLRSGGRVAEKHLRDPALADWFMGAATEAGESVTPDNVREPGGRRLRRLERAVDPRPKILAFSCIAYQAKPSPR